MLYGFKQDLAFAESRLVGSLVRDEYDNVVLVEKVYNKGILRTRDILSGCDNEAPLERYNLSPFPMGYTNNPERRLTHYITRQAARQWKHGVRETTCRDALSARGVSFLDIALSYKPKFKNIEQSLDILHNEWGQPHIAISRSFGIFMDKGKVSLAYKGYKVGQVNCDNGDLVLGEDKIFLSEVLKEETL
jgi:hypothetical protein